QIVIRDELPLGATGKLQRIGMAERIGLDAEARPGWPSRTGGRLTPREAAMLGIWSSVLDVADLSPDDDFVKSGGDSLAAMQLVVDVLDTLGVAIPVSSLFEEGSTARSMAALVERSGAGRGASATPEHNDANASV